MIGKKYELIKSDIKGLYRVKALIDFSDVQAGDIGGYVHHENNLSHYGDCWIYDEAKVINNARVSGFAKVLGDATVSDNARVYGDATVSDNAKIYGNAEVSGDDRRNGSIFDLDFSKIKEYGKWLHALVK